MAYRVAMAAMLGPRIARMPSPLRDEVENRFRAARMARDSFAVETLNTLRAALQNEEIAKQAELADEDVLRLLRRELRQLGEAEEAFGRSGALDMAAEAARRTALLSPLLPPEMPEAEILAVIDEEMAALGPKCTLGPAMGLVMGRLRGVPGKRVRDLLVKRLGER